MSYDTHFKVKYNDIEQELINKLTHKTPKEPEENPDDEYEYSSEDVNDICNKLYRDEFLSVFGAEDIMDDKIDNGMNYVYDIMMKNEKFKQIVDEIIILTLKEINTNQEFNSEHHESLKQLILISLFSQNLFHITHKCICQQIEVGVIDDELIDELIKLFVELCQNQLRV